MIGAVKGSEDVSGERVLLLGRVKRPQSSSFMKPILRDLRNSITS